MISLRMLDGGLPGRKLWPRFWSGLELLLVPGASISHQVGSQDLENASFTCSLKALMNNLPRKLNQN